MTAIPFDTLKLAKDLRERAHFSAEQAEGTAAALADAFQDQVATKSDIDRLQASTKSDIDRLEASTKSDIDRLGASTKSDIAAVRADFTELRSEMEHRFESLEQRVTIKIGGMFVVAIGVLTALLKLIH